MVHTRSGQRRAAALMGLVLSVGLVAVGSATASAADTAIAAAPEPTATRSLDNDMVSPADLLGPAGASARRQADTGPGFPVANFVQASHAIDVAVVAPAGTTAPTITDAAIGSLVAKTGTYWNAQSNGQVVGLSLNPAVQRYASPLTCNNQIDLAPVWTEAAVRFGHTDLSYYLSTQSRHLMVIVPPLCGGVGVGSVGAPIQASNGGVIWASLSGTNDLDIVAHEFGHNLGLLHSNTHSCPDATISEGLLDALTNTFSDGCTDNEYLDAYDLMGAAVSVVGQVNAQPTALNVTHKARLDALVPGEVQDVSLPTGQGSFETTVTLGSTGAASGLRALRVTDPRTGRTYYVDFRGGGGTDTGSLYEQGLLASVGSSIGVRVLTLRDTGASVVLLDPSRRLHLAVGGSLSSRSGGVTVTELSASVGTGTPTASVRVTLRGVLAAGVLPAMTRLSGADRYATAVAVSQNGYPGTAPIVYVATGANYPDALAAAPAAALKGGPLLLTGTTNLPVAVKAEIERLKPQRIVVVGGASVVSAAVEAQLASPGVTVTRIAGADRYETSRAIIDDAFVTVTDAYVATGRNYPDALAAAAAAGAHRSPVLLVDGLAGSLDTATLALIATLGITKVTIAGGPAVVGAGVEASLANAGVTVTRQGGADRFATALLLNQAAFTQTTELFFATGLNFPDALAGAALAGMRGAPLYLVPGTCVPSGVRADMSRLGVTTMSLVGGPSVLAESVATLTPCA